MRLVYSFILLFLPSCVMLGEAVEPLLFKPEERVSIIVEPTFSEDPIYNFKTRVDEGWEFLIEDGILYFIRGSNSSVEIYQPIK